MLLDAGGGTVDASTYKVDELATALRLKQEAVPPGGKTSIGLSNKCSN